jgi:predicted peptidase
MFRPHVLVLALAALAVPGWAGAQDQPAQAQSAQTFKRQITKTVTGNYLLYIPADYKRDKHHPTPLLMFLHGSGERGDDLEMVKRHGPPKLIAAGHAFPFIVVSPQCPSDSRGWDTDMLMGLLDEVSHNYTVDPDRIYLTGLSMGGFGTWQLAIDHPDKFAAIAPICGAADSRNAAKIKDLPIWVFHGAKDETVSIEPDKAMVAALKALGSTVKFTVYPDLGHDSWTVTYDNPDLYTWLLQQKRGHPAAGETGR